MRAPPWIAVCLNQRLTEKPSCEAGHVTAPIRDMHPLALLLRKATSHVLCPTRRIKVHASDRLTRFALPGSLSHSANVLHHVEQVVPKINYCAADSLSGSFTASKASNSTAQGS